VEQPTRLQEGADLVDERVDAAAALFFASDESGSVTGDVMVVDGASLLRAPASSATAAFASRHLAWSGSIVEQRAKSSSFASDRRE
jgi:hypothetical protein